MKRNFLTACLVMAAATSFAQKDSVLTDSFHILAPVEVRATRVNEKSPFAASNISSPEIQKKNLGQGLPGLLDQVPSVVVSSDDGVGVGYSSLRIRGTDITRINVTFNGIPVNDPESQGTFFVDIPDLGSSTGSIQVQRGVGSSTNGPGAFGASVNISNLDQQKAAGASISSAYGSFNTWKNTLLAHTGLLNNGFQFDLRLSKLNSDGYIDRAFSDLKSLHFISGWRSANEKTAIKFNLMTGKERTGQAWNGIGTSYTDKSAPVDYEKQLDAIGRTTNTLGKISDNKYYNDQTDNYQQDYYQLFINQKFGESWTANISGFLTRGKGYYNEYKAGETFSDYGLPDTLTIGNQHFTTTNLTRQLWLDNFYYGSVFSANYSKKNTGISLGGALTRYDGRHYGYVKWAEMGFPLDYRWYRLTSLKKDVNFFAKLEQQILSGFFAFGDLQVRDVDYLIHGFRTNPGIESDNHYTFFNPKVGLSYLIKHAYNRSSKVYTSFAVANKEPNRDDFEASTANKPKAERLQDIEVGYNFQSSGFQAGINGYYMKYKDQLILTGKINDVGAYVRTNVENSYRAGIEMTASLKPANWIQVQGNATLSQNKISDLTQYADNYDQGGQIEEHLHKTDIAFSPNTIAGATVTFEPFTATSQKNHFFLDLVEKYVSRQYLDNASNRLRSINPYSLSDVRLRYHRSGKLFKESSFILMVNNLFDKKYENNGYTYSYRYGGTMTTENYYFPQAGINWNFGVTLGF